MFYLGKRYTAMTVPSGNQNQQVFLAIMRFPRWGLIIKNVMVGLRITTFGTIVSPLVFSQSKDITITNDYYSLIEFCPILRGLNHIH